MKFTIFTHVSHMYKESHYFAYAPYVDEMNIWEKNIGELVIVAPLTPQKPSVIDSCYRHENIKFIAVSSFDLLSPLAVFKTILKLPTLFYTLYKAMHAADHIHLRCPGNIGLLGCIVQMMFPKTPKSAKYAGNWDPKSRQSWSYKLQKWILSNTFLTRNMKVLVYGEWEGSSRNIHPFFTATYSEKEKEILIPKLLGTPIDFVFVGALVKGKNPLYAIQMIENLYQKGFQVRLSIYGEGVQRQSLEEYLFTNKLGSIVTLFGNQTKEVVKKAYQNSHFVVLPSDSEGWPKVIAEGMFWGCVPIATPVSCVPFMLDYGNRGILLAMNLESDIAQLEALISLQSDFNNKSIQAAVWSREYTLEVFETEILKLLK